MDTTKLVSNGRITLPKSVRDARHWKPGTEFAVETVMGGVLLRPIKPFPPTRIEDVAGCLRYDGPPKTLEEMDEAITQGSEGAACTRPILIRRAATVRERSEMRA